MYINLEKAKELKKLGLQVEGYDKHWFVATYNGNTELLPSTTHIRTMGEYYPAYKESEYNLMIMYNHIGIKLTREMIDMLSNKVASLEFNSIPTLTQQYIHKNKNLVCCCSLAGTLACDNCSNRITEYSMQQKTEPKTNYYYHMKVEFREHGKEEPVEYSRRTLSKMKKNDYDLLKDKLDCTKVEHYMKYIEKCYIWDFELDKINYMLHDNLLEFRYNESCYDIIVIFELFETTEEYEEYEKVIHVQYDDNNIPVAIGE